MWIKLQHAEKIGVFDEVINQYLIGTQYNISCPNNNTIQDQLYWNCSINFRELTIWNKCEGPQISYLDLTNG